jgi:hypothetical protein
MITRRICGSTCSGSIGGVESSVERNNIRLSLIAAHRIQ